MTFTPEEEAMFANYYGAAPQPPPAPTVAAPAQPTPFEPGPAEDDAIAAAYFAGQPRPAPSAATLESAIGAANAGAPPPAAPPAAPPPPSVGLPPVSMTRPGDLFGQRAAPAQAPGREAVAGPTPEDDAAFKAAVATKGEWVSAPPPRPVGHGGGGKPNQDPYGIRGAQHGVIDSYAAREASMRQAAMVDEQKAAVIGGEATELARRRQEDAELAGREQQTADDDFSGRMQSLQKQMDDVRAKKVDPTRATKDIGFLAVIGGMMGGLYMGLTKGQENPFLRDLDRMIDRDIAIQERAIDKEERGVGNQMNVLGMQRAQFKDSQAAKMATRIMYYEAAQSQIEADAARFDSAIRKELAEEAVQTLEMEKQKQILTFAEHNQTLAARGAAAQHAKQKEVQALYRDVYDKVLGATGNVAVAEQEARRQVGVVYAPGSVGERAPQAGGTDPVAMVPKDRRDEAVKEMQAHANKGNVVGSIGKSFQAWRSTSALSPRQLDSTRSAIAGTIMANVPGIRSDVDFKEIVEPNLPARGDSEETLRLKEKTIRQFVESKTTTPILDAHAPGWRQPSAEETKTLMGFRKPQ